MWMVVWMIFLYHVITCWTVQNVPRPHLTTAGIGSSPWMNEQMNGRLHVVMKATGLLLSACEIFFSSNSELVQGLPPSDTTSVWSFLIAFPGEERRCTVHVHGHGSRATRLRRPSTSPELTWKQLEKKNIYIYILQSFKSWTNFQLGRIFYDFWRPF